MSKIGKITQTDEAAWESGPLGKSEEHAKPFEEPIEADIDNSAQLQMISIRLPKYVIDSFKFIAMRNKNIGYQTLMRQILHRFVVAELKNISTEMQAAAEKFDELPARKTA